VDPLDGSFFEDLLDESSWGRFGVADPALPEYLGFLYPGSEAAGKLGVTGRNKAFLPLRFPRAERNRHFRGPRHSETIGLRFQSF